MAGEYIDDLKQNYRDLHDSTGESFESIAARVESHGDKNLAAWLRSSAAAEAPGDPSTAAPQDRQAPGNRSLKAAADSDAEAEAKAAADAAAAEAAAKADADAAAEAAAADAKAKADAKTAKA